MKKTLSYALRTFLDLSNFFIHSKLHGYETKGAFGTVHVLNSHESQKSAAIKLYKIGFNLNTLVIDPNFY